MIECTHKSCLETVWSVFSSLSYLFWCLSLFSHLLFKRVLLLPLILTQVLAKGMLQVGWWRGGNCKLREHFMNVRKLIGSTRVESSTLKEHVGRVETPLEVVVTTVENDHGLANSTGHIIAVSDVHLSVGVLPLLTVCRVQYSLHVSKMLYLPLVLLLKKVPGVVWKAPLLWNAYRHLNGFVVVWRVRPGHPTRLTGVLLLTFQLVGPETLGHVLTRNGARWGLTPTALLFRIKWRIW